MQIHYANCQGDERANENLKILKMVRCHGVLNIVSIPNGRIPFCGGQGIV
jgi:hypothetical protein